MLVSVVMVKRRHYRDINLGEVGSGVEIAEAATGERAECCSVCDVSRLVWPGWKGLN